MKSAEVKVGAVKEFVETLLEVRHMSIPTHLTLNEPSVTSNITYGV